MTYANARVALLAPEKKALHSTRRRRPPSVYTLKGALADDANAASSSSAFSVSLGASAWSEPVSWAVGVVNGGRWGGGLRIFFRPSAVGRQARDFWSASIHTRTAGGVGAWVETTAPWVGMDIAANILQRRSVSPFLGPHFLCPGGTGCCCPCSLALGDATGMWRMSSAIGEILS